ncbi:hypothetical protein QO200_08115 [Flavobacterium sp. Arc3]|jgi:hypothetical protein
MSPKNPLKKISGIFKVEEMIQMEMSVKTYAQIEKGGVNLKFSKLD